MEISFWTVWSTAFFTEKKEDSTLVIDNILPQSVWWSVFPVPLNSNWNCRCSQKAGNQYSYTDGNWRAIMPAYICHHQNFHPLQIWTLMKRQFGLEFDGSLSATLAASDVLFCVLTSPSLCKTFSALRPVFNCIRGCLNWN